MLPIILHLLLQSTDRCTAATTSAAACLQGAVTVARRVAEERRVELGSEVGYAVRFENRTSSSTKIKYLTGAPAGSSIASPATCMLHPVQHLASCLHNTTSQ
jgi:hypothetical protein